MKQYIVDAFTDCVFSGNPAAVCVLDDWLDAEQMQNIAIENNLSETAFTVKEKDGYQLRWFTPGGEIDFCGHATLATAYILFHCYQILSTVIHFHTQIGTLTVQKKGDLYEMDFPAYQCHPIPVTDAMEQAIGIRPTEAYLDRDLLLVLENADTVKNLQPNQTLLKELDGLCVIVTAKGKQYDCVSRVFAPKLGIPEDPVTGSSHCMIVPYWCKKLDKREIVAYQASRRSGVLYAKQENDRILIAGKAVLFAISDILLEHTHKLSLEREHDTRNYKK